MDCTMCTLPQLCHISFWHTDRNLFLKWIIVHSRCTDCSKLGLSHLIKHHHYTVFSTAVLNIAPHNILPTAFSKSENTVSWPVYELITWNWPAERWNGASKFFVELIAIAFNLFAMLFHYCIVIALWSPASIYNQLQYCSRSNKEKQMHTYLSLCLIMPPF